MKRTIFSISRILTIMLCLWGSISWAETQALPKLTYYHGISSVSNDPTIQDVELGTEFSGEEDAPTDQVISLKIGTSHLKREGLLQSPKASSSGQSERISSQPRDMAVHHHTPKEFSAIITQHDQWVRRSTE